MRTLRIFISSPGDVGREREIARRVIPRVEASFGRRIKLEPYFWEHEPMRGTFDPQQNIPDTYDFDIVVCILWSRLGSRLHPGRHQRADGTPYASGTQFEFERAVEGWSVERQPRKPDLLIFQRIEQPSFPPEPRDELLRRSDQWEALKEFIKKWFTDAAEGTFNSSKNEYTSLTEFEDKLEIYLRKIIGQRLAQDEGTDAAAAVPIVTWTNGSPYRGLRAFDFEHEAIFFGRTRARDEVLGLLQRRDREEGCPFVLILGASGSGKSSLLRAGVFPWLVQPGVVDGIGLWRWLILKPSEISGDLFDGLATALLGPTALPEAASEGKAGLIAAQLRESPASLGLWIMEALDRAAETVQRTETLPRPPAARLAIGLDQLEEIFTLADRFTADHRRDFFRALISLVKSRRVWIVATLRSDFYHRCEEIEELVELKKGNGSYHLLPPTPSEISQMIRLPAQAAGVHFEDHPDKGRLEEAIRDEAIRNPGALPLLEYALDELYTVGHHDGLLTHQEYDELGGVAGALGKRADEAYAKVDDSDQKTLRSLGRALVSAATSNHAFTRRKCCKAELFSDPNVAKLTTEFIEMHLLSSDLEHGKPMVTITHEFLITEWKPLRESLESDRRFLQLRERLLGEAEEWARDARPTDLLIRAGQLRGENRFLLQSNINDLAGVLREYVDASLAPVLANEETIRIQRAEQDSDIAKHHLKNGRCDDALRAIDQALDSAPDNAAYRHTKVIVLEALGDFNKARQCIPSCDAEDTLLHIRLLLHEQSLALAKEMIAQIMPRASFLDEDLRKGLRLFSKDHATWSCVGADDWLKARVWHLETWVIWLEGTQPFSRTFSRKDQLLEAAIAWKRGRKINAIRMLAQLHLIEAVTKTPSPSPSVQDMYAILGRKATTRSRLPADALLDRAYEFLDSNGERGDLRFVTAWNCPLEAVRFIREVSEFASSHSFIRMLLHARDVKEDISVEPKRWLPWIALAVTSAVWIPQLRDLLSAGQLCSELLSTIPGNSSHVWEYTVLASLIILCRFPVRLMEKGIIAWLSGRLFGAICFVQGTVFTSLIAAQIMEKTSKAGKNFSESGWFVMGFFAVWVSGPLIGLWTGWKCNPDVNIRT